MTPNLLDFSRRAELAQHARVIADVLAAAMAPGVTVIIVGAFARDLLVHYAHGLMSSRVTEDVDVALAVADWRAFAELMQGLQDSGRFREVPGSPHRLRHSTSDLPVDLVPFGGLETPDRRIDWPPRGDVVMDVFGFKEALPAAWRVRLPQGEGRSCRHRPSPCSSW